ncbi:MAG: hypothetical protein J5981_03330 [Lachnospira sp.]|nr:hypothetical protein [Lachnospira sp.]
MELLQKYVFIPLDIFRERHQNITSKTEAWLTFLSTDRPEQIIQLIKKYPQFREMYEEIYVICRNVERVMEMFSKELLELDKNTVQYMIDEMQETIDSQKNQLEEQQNKLEEKQETIDGQRNQLEEKQETIDSQKKQLEEKQNEIEETKQLLSQALQKIKQLEKEKNN